MSTIFCKLCHLILQEYFNADLAKVGKDLFKSGPKSFRAILRTVRIPHKIIRHSLCVLIKYGLVTFEISSTGVVEYRLIAENVLNMLRYPKYLLVTKSAYGSEAEMIVEEALRAGHASAIQIVIGAYNKVAKIEGFREVNTEKLQSLRDHFEVLVNKQYLKRCTDVTSDPIPVPVNPASKNSKSLKLEMPTLAKIVANGSSIEEYDPILWSVNFSRFHLDMRDDILVLAVCRRVSTAGGEAFRQLLKQSNLISAWDATNSNPVPFTMIRDACKKAKMDISILKHLEDYLTIISEDSCGFVTKVSGVNAAFVVNTKNAFKELTWHMLANIVEFNFGSQAARIFRLIREQKFIEQEEIQKKAMLPDKDCKFLTYRLVQTGWIQQQELRKGISKTGPSKTFFLFYIDLNLIVRMCIELCYKALGNSICRRNHELSQNASLLEKKQRIEALSYHMKETGASDEEVAEIADLITPAEATLINKIESNINQLDQTGVQIDDTLFILQLYLSFLS